MDSVRNSMSFYLANCDVMYAIYNEEDDNLWADYSDKEKKEITQKVERVCDRAEEQALTFVNACLGRMEKHFSKLCKCECKTRDCNKKSYWECELLLWKRGARKPSKIQCTVGWSWDYEEKTGPAILPWIWVKGGRLAEDRLAMILGERAVKHSVDSGLSKGCITLNEVMTKASESTDFELNWNDIIEQVVQPFERITAEDMEAIFQIN